MKKITILTTMLLALVANAWADGVHFTYDPNTYEKATVVYLSLVDQDGTTPLSEEYYVGAYIGEECRAEAQWERQLSGGLYEPPFYVLRVGGLESENGQKITFRVYSETLMADYIIPESQFVTFNGGDAEVGSPSDPVKIKLIPGYDVNVTSTQVHVGERETFDLATLTEKPNADAAYPAFTFTLIGSDPGDKINLEGSVVTGVTAGTEPAIVEFACGTRTEQFSDLCRQIRHQRIFL